MSACSCQASDTTICSSSTWNSHALQQLMACIARCAMLTTLDLSRCRMNSSCMRALGANLHALPALQHLSMNGLVPEASNSSEGFSTGSFRPICTALPKLTLLSHLSLCNNDMTTHFQLLARAVQNMHALQFMDVGGNAPDLHSLACLVAAAAKAPQLHTLSLDRLEVSCSGEWFFTVQLLQQCAAAFFEVVGAPLCSSSPNPDTSQPMIPPDSPNRAQYETHGAPAPSTPPLNPHVAQIGSSIRRSRRRSGRCNSTGLPCMTRPFEFKTSAPFKSLSLQNLTVESLAMPSLLQLAVLDVAWSPSPHSSMHGPELEEATPATFAHAWRLADTLQGLTALDLTGADFEGFWDAPQSDFIASLHVLRDLRMARCNLPFTALPSLCTALAGAQRLTAGSAGLTALDWRENPVGSDAIQPLCGMTALQSLRLQGCGLQRHQQAELHLHVTRLAALTRLEVGLSGGEGRLVDMAAAA